MRIRPQPRWLAVGALALASSALGSAAAAQTASSASAGASVVLGNVITVARSADLAFGRIIITNAASPATVTVGTANSVTGISNATEMSGATIGSASFTVSGVADATYAVSFPQASISLGGGASPPTVDTFTSNPSGSAGLLSAGGTQTVSVGGTLHVPANTTTGAYTGTFQVSVAYN